MLRIRPTSDILTPLRLKESRRKYKTGVFAAPWNVDREIVLEEIPKISERIKAVYGIGYKHKHRKLRKSKWMHCIIEYPKKPKNLHDCSREVP